MKGLPWKVLACVLVVSEMLSRVLRRVSDLPAAPNVAKLPLLVEVYASQSWNSGNTFESSAL